MWLVPRSARLNVVRSSKPIGRLVRTEARRWRHSVGGAHKEAAPRRRGFHKAVSPTPRPLSSAQRSVHGRESKPPRAQLRTGGRGGGALPCNFIQTEVFFFSFFHRSVRFKEEISVTFLIPFCRDEMNGLCPGNTFKRVVRRDAEHNVTARLETSLKGTEVLYCQKTNNV